MIEIKERYKFHLTCIRCGYKVEITTFSGEQAITAGFQLHDIRQHRKEFPCVSPLRKYTIRCMGKVK